MGQEFWITVLEELSEESYHSNDEIDEMEVIIPLVEHRLMEDDTGFVDFIDLWNTFGIWNLATGWRSGLVEGIGEGVFESYSYADRLDEVAHEKMSEEINKLEDTHRFYPLSASYFWFQHDGETLPFYTSTFRNDTPLYFALLSVSSEQDGLFGDIENIIDVWEGQAHDFRQWDLPTGDYWLIGLVGGLADESQKTTFCIGSLCDQDDFVQPENESEDFIDEEEKRRDTWMFLCAISYNWLLDNSGLLFCEEEKDMILFFLGCPHEEATTDSMKQAYYQITTKSTF